MIGMDTTTRGLVWLSVLLGGLWAQAALAQPGDLKIGFVNAEMLLLEAPQTQVALRTLNDEFAPRQRDVVAMQNSLREKTETYERDRDVMGETERVSLEREIRDGRRDLERAETEFTEDLNIRRNELLAVAQRAVSEQIETYATREGYDLILQNVVYHSASVDITSQILSFLNESVLQGDSE